MNKNVIISKITKNDFDQSKELIKDYLSWIDIDLSFQQIEEELNSFPEKYEEPKGSFYVAKDGNKVVGCIGLKENQDNICEMKRLYVSDEYKGFGIGKELIKTIIDEAKRKGYERMRLDTLPKMKSAQRLYKGFGFYEIEQYLINPIKGAVFMEKMLNEE
ncbi:MAG: GNAT family N-acetyltransferase [Ignavibacteriaceae bacterium]